jgi:hypothetical protein
MTKRHVEIIFSRKGLRPGLIRFKDLAEVLTAIENAVASLMVKGDSSLTQDGVGLCLVGVKEGSAVFRLEGMAPSLIHPAFEAFTHAIATEGAAPTQQVTSSVQKIQILCAKYNCSAEFRNRSGSKWPDAVIRAAREIPLEVEQHSRIHGETIIYGVLESVGGVEPKAWLRTRSERLGFEVTRDEARALGARLYSAVGIRGIAAWSAATGEIESFKFIELTAYEETSLKKAFSELAEEFGHFFDAIEDVDAFVLKQRQE